MLVTGGYFSKMKKIGLNYHRKQLLCLNFQLLTSIFSFGDSVFRLSTSDSSDQNNFGLIKHRNINNTVKLEMFADINVCECYFEGFRTFKVCILGLPEVNFVFPTNSVLLLLLLIGYIR